MEDKIDFLVRYSETDQMSFVYHGNYVKYFEMGRIAWLKKLGISYRQMEDDGILLPCIQIIFTAFINNGCNTFCACWNDIW